MGNDTRIWFVLLVIVMAAGLLAGCGAEGFYVPGSLSQKPQTSVCEQEEFSGGLICQTLTANGYTAEDSRDVILDMEAIGLITEKYTVDDIRRITDKVNDFLLKDNLQYGQYFQYLGDDLKAQQIAGIVSRRLGGLPMGEMIREGDRKLLLRLNTRIREASGIYD